jgi:hypothetical protein
MGLRVHHQILIQAGVAGGGATHARKTFTCTCPTGVGIGSSSSQLRFPALPVARVKACGATASLVPRAAVSICPTCRDLPNAVALVYWDRRLGATSPAPCGPFKGGSWIICPELQGFESWGPASNYPETPVGMAQPLSDRPRCPLWFAVARGFFARVQVQALMIQKYGMSWGLSGDLGLL